MLVPGRKNFRDLIVEKIIKIGADGSLHAAELLGWLFEKSTERGKQLVAALVPAIHEHLHDLVRVFLLHQDMADVWNRDERTDVAKNFKGELNCELRLGWEKRILATSASQ